MLSRRSLGGSALALLLALVAASPARAQLGGLLDKLIPPALRASEPLMTDGPPGAGPTPPPPGARVNSDSRVLAGEAPPVGPKKDIRAEMAPDADCSRPQERFNVAEKLAEYGGTAAGLRLQRLVESDYRYSDLTEQDKQMLQYLARTTVWLPAEVESKLGAIYQTASGLFGGGAKASELDQAALQGVAQRLDQLKGAAADFPAAITLSLNKELPDGAFARFGGVIELSERFLNGLSENPVGADFVLAHELSHIYKRHPVKDLQFKLISSNEGWELGRKVLQRAQRGMQVDPIRDGMFALTTVPQLITFVRQLQLKFGREQELEADACSTHWLRAIGSDPVAAWDGYRQTLGATSEAGNGYTASHPTTAEREERFKRKAAGTPPGQTKPRPPGKDKTKG